jgi:hypothetical protein
VPKAEERSVSGGRSDALDEDHCVVLRAYDAFVVQARRVVVQLMACPLRFDSH